MQIFLLFSGLVNKELFSEEFLARKGNLKKKESKSIMLLFKPWFVDCNMFSNMLFFWY